MKGKFSNFELPSDKRIFTKGGFPLGEMTGRETATKLFRHETTFNFHMNNFCTIIENKA